MNDSTRLHASTRVLFTPLADGTGVLLDLDSKFYFTLNRAGVTIWDRLSDGGGTVLELADAIAAKFDIGASDAVDDVRALVQELADESLVAEEPA